MVFIRVLLKTMKETPIVLFIREIENQMTTLFHGFVIKRAVD